MRVFSVKRFLRRGVAAALAVAVFCLLRSALPAAAADSEATSSDWESALTLRLLKAELGDPARAGLPLTLRLLADQIPLLDANLDNLLFSEVTPAPTEEPLPNAQPAPDRDDLQDEPQVTSAPDSIVERTLIPSAAGGYVTGGGLYLYNRTDLTVDLEAVASAPLSFTLSSSDAPQILIIHTHTTEAYTPDGTDIYEPSDENSRTLEEEYNMLRIGDELERVFTEMGLSVLHDRGVYDYPRYNGAYTRSGEAVAEYLKEYPSLRLVLDVHRDALVDSNGTVYKVVTTVDGVKAAQVMLVTGTDENGANHPDWTENLALAARLQKSLDTLYPTLARPMALRSSSYNQELSPGFLLVEIGSHGNTLQEALAGARCFARAAGAVFLGLVE